jgi:hypothetical protein
MYVPGGIYITLRIKTLAKLQLRLTHDVRPSNGKAQIGICNENMYNVLQCIVARLFYSSHVHESALGPFGFLQHMVGVRGLEMNTNTQVSTHMTGGSRLKHRVLIELPKRGEGSRRNEMKLFTKIPDETGCCL